MSDTSSPTAPDQEMLNFSTARDKLQALITDWNPQKKLVRENRKKRYIEADVEMLQTQGVLKSDETLIQARVIDTNIRQEQPAYVNFLINSRRVVSFKNNQDYSANCQQIEDQFTSGMRYKGWDLPFYKCIDGAQMHGWDAVEVELDLSKPLHVGINHISNENLIFPIDAKDVQACEMLIVRYELTKSKLKEFVSKYGFDKIQVDRLLEASEKGTRHKNVEVFKMYCKVDGVVWVAWYGGDKCDGWILEPRKLFLGVRNQVELPIPDNVIAMSQLTGAPVPQPQTTWQDADVTEYPIKVNVYNVSEESCITSHRGRVFLDTTKQEAQTGIWSGIVNGCLRASNVYACVDQPNPEGGAPKQIDCALEHGGIYDVKLSFFNTPYPDPMLIKAAQALDTQTKAETGQVNFAVNNREDSRKTATEIDAANQQSMLLSSVQVSLFSNFVTEVYTLAWNIVQSQAIQGEINFMQIEQDGALGMEKVNDIATISQDYEIKSAGDVDVIERDQKLKTTLALVPLVQNTALWPEYFKDIMRLSFPEDSARYLRLLDEADQTNQLVSALASALRTAVTLPTGAIKPEYAASAQQLMQLGQQTQQWIIGHNPALAQQQQVQARGQKPTQQAA